MMMMMMMMIEDDDFFVFVLLMFNIERLSYGKFLYITIQNTTQHMRYKNEHRFRQPGLDRDSEHIQHTTVTHLQCSEFTSVLVPHGSAFAFFFSPGLLRVLRLSNYFFFGNSHLNLSNSCFSHTSVISLRHS